MSSCLASSHESILQLHAHTCERALQGAIVMLWCGLTQACCDGRAHLDHIQKVKHAWNPLMCSW
jgi:hypothetical protein